MILGRFYRICHRSAWATDTWTNLLERGVYLQPDGPSRERTAVDGLATPDGVADQGRGVAEFVKCRPSEIPDDWPPGNFRILRLGSSRICRRADPRILEDALSSSLSLKLGLYRQLGYQDSRIKRVEKMRCWEFGPPPKQTRYHTTSYVLVYVEETGEVQVLVAGDAPIDQVVEAKVQELGGLIRDHRSSTVLTKRHIVLKVSPPFDHIVQLAEAIAGLPGRRTPADPNRQHFFEAPLVVTYLRAAHRALTAADSGTTG